MKHRSTVCSPSGKFHPGVEPGDVADWSQMMMIDEDDTIRYDTI